MDKIINKIEILLWLNIIRSNIEQEFLNRSRTPNF